jgi:hypothetical protein
MFFNDWKHRNMKENTIRERKNIDILFQKLLSEHFKPFLVSTPYLLHF